MDFERSNFGANERSSATWTLNISFFELFAAQSLFSVRLVMEWNKVNDTLLEKVHELRLHLQIIFHSIAQWCVFSKILWNSIEQQKESIFVTF